MGSTIDSSALDVGSVVDGWRLEAVLGRGGMGVVYRAVHETSGISAAMKVFQPGGSEGQQALRRFRREVLALARLEHPLVVRVLQESLAHEPPYFCMELLPGGSLAQRLEAAGGGGVPAETLTRLALELAEGLEAVHGARVLHRDIKPQNVLFTVDGQAKLADFGIAKAKDLTALTMVGQVMGTFAYMAPESICGKPGDERTDLYQLGVTLFEAATGRKPFTSQQIMAVMANRRLPLLSKLAPLTSQKLPWLQPVLDSLTACSPDARFKSASELLATLRRESDRFPLPASGAQFPAAAALPPPGPSSQARTELSELRAPARAPEREPSGQAQTSLAELQAPRVPETTPTELSRPSDAAEPVSPARDPAPPPVAPPPERPRAEKPAPTPPTARLRNRLAVGSAALFGLLLVAALAWRLGGSARSGSGEPPTAAAALRWTSAGPSRVRLWLSGPAPSGAQVEWNPGDHAASRTEAVRTSEHVVTLEGLEPGQACAGELRLGETRLPFTASTTPVGEFPYSAVLSERVLASASIQLWASEDHVRLSWVRLRPGGGCDLFLAESMDQGQTWGEPVQLAAAGGGLTEPQVTLSSSGPWFAWTDSAAAPGGTASARGRPGNPLAPRLSGPLVQAGGPASTVGLVAGPGSSAELYVGSRDEGTGVCRVRRARLDEGESRPPALRPAFELGAHRTMPRPRVLRTGDSLLALVATGPADDEKALYWSACAAGAEGAWTPPAMLTGNGERVRAFDAVQHETKLVVAYELGQAQGPAGSQVKVSLLAPDGSTSAESQTIREVDLSPVLAAGAGDCFLGALARSSGGRALFRLLRADAGAGWGAFREFDCECRPLAGPERFALAVAGERLVIAHVDSGNRLLATSLRRHGD